MADENGDVGQAKLEDSNMAGYGGEEMRNLRKDAAATDKSLAGAGSKVGMEVWRVENKRTENDTPDFGIARWPKDQVGQFYTGDSYICLNTYHPKDPETGKVNKDKLAWDVHFWLGEETSIDERGVAAYKTVEIDDLLDDGPIQHREVQGSESAKFQSYFAAIEYLEGGIASGFREVKEEEYEPRLIQVRRTKKTVRGIPRKCKASEMNEGDVFILDAGKKVYLWVGKEASAFEKSKGANLVHNIIGRRNGKAKKVDPDKDSAEFWKILGGGPGDVQSAESADKKAEPSLDAESVSLFKLSDASGSIKFETVAENSTITKDMLDSNDAFIVASNIEVFAWIGTGASKSERSQAMKYATEWLEGSGLPNSTPITVIKEGQVPHNAVWESCFKQ